MSKTKSITEALVIVDMQDDFLERMGDEGFMCIDEVRAAYRKLLKGILREVKEAKRKRIPIVCLTYANQEDGFDSPKESWEYHATDSKIRAALKGYSRVYHAQKDDDGGGEMVMDILEGVEPRLGLERPSYRGKLPKLRKYITDEHKMIDFTVVGVNADACVLCTCNDLVDAGHKCRVPSDAAMNVWDCSFASASELVEADGVRVIVPERKAAA
jgi:nicotinamidase-related amidase